MTFRDVRVFYLQELRSALRERNIVIYSILLPLLLYPALLWLVFTGVTFVRGQSAAQVSRVALVGLPERHEALRAELDADPLVDVVEVASADAVAAEMRAGRLDAALDFSPHAAAGAEPPGDVRISIAYDDSKERSSVARDRVTAVVERYRADWLERSAARLGVEPGEWQQFYLTTVDTASPRELGAFLLKLILPSLLLAMIALGCFYPAIDATAGERERSTWETTMTLAADRSSIVAAKYLYVATLGVAAGILNVVAMVVSLGPVISSLTAGGGRSAAFRIPPTAIPVVLLGAVLIALFIAAAMMIAASFARTFKEGQTMVSPFYFVVIMPVFFLQSPDLEFTPALALIPVVNVAMMFRDAIGGLFQWHLIAITVVVEAVTIVGCLAVARRILRFEDVLVGSFNGSFFKFMRERLLGAGRRAAASEAP